MQISHKVSRQTISRTLQKKNEARIFENIHAKTLLRREEKQPLRISNFKTILFNHQTREGQNKRVAYLDYTAKTGRRVNNFHHT